MNTVVLVLSLDSITIVVIISSTDDKMEVIIIIPSNLVPHDLSYINACPHLEDIMPFIHVVLEEYTSLATTSAERLSY